MSTKGPIFLAFSRVFSGVLRRGQTLYVLQPRYDPCDAILEEEVRGEVREEVKEEVGEDESGLPPNVSKFTVGDLYILMGRGVVPVDQVSAGNVVGIAGLEDVVVKSATLSSTLSCPSFGAMSFIATPIVRVAVEPQNIADLSALVDGMKLLNQADPSVEVYVQETGEHVVAGAGEVHLQKCLDDLERLYARIKLRVSEPIVPFRETVVVPPKVDMVNEEISSVNEVRLVTRPTHSEPSNTGIRLVQILLRESYT